MSIQIVPVTERDWRQVRDLRLQALADTPHAFMETLLHAAEQPDEEWQGRARRCEEPNYTGIAAVDNGRWVGTMRGEVTSDGRGRLIGVFVARSHRGSQFGVADELLDRIEQWMRNHALSEIFLEVHEHNLRAQAFYQRRGYQFTGHRQPYPLEQREFELEMRRDL